MTATPSGYEKQFPALTRDVYDWKHFEDRYARIVIEKMMLNPKFPTPPNP